MEDRFVFIGSDHAGFELKRSLIEAIPTLQDVGCFPTQVPQGYDYPDIGHRVANHVVFTEGGRGILVCGTGEGMCMVANKHPGVRAGVAWKPAIAQAIREHNDANVLCLPALHLSSDEAVSIVATFLSTPFSTEERHARRVSKIELQTLSYPPSK